MLISNKSDAALCNHIELLVIFLVVIQKSILCAYRRQVMEFDIQLRDVREALNFKSFILISF